MIRIYFFNVNKAFVFGMVIPFIFSCTVKQEQKSAAVALKIEDAKPEVELTLLKLSDAVKTKNIELVKSCLPSDFSLQFEKGQLFNKDQFIDLINEDWSTLVQTHFTDISFKKFEIIDKQVKPQLAIRWERKMRNSTGGIDIIFSTYEISGSWKLYNTLWLPHVIQVEEKSRMVNEK